MSVFLNVPKLIAEQIYNKTFAYYYFNILEYDHSNTPLFPITI